jgi:uncharacterized protein (DUF885 family)
MKLRYVLGVFAAGLLSAGVAFGSTESIEQFFERFTLDWFRLDPIQATMAQCFEGAEQDAADRLLTPVSDAYDDKRSAFIRQGLVQLRHFDRAKLTARERLHADLMEWQLENLLRNAQMRDFTFPFDQMFGVQVWLPDFVTKLHPLRNARDVENYNARLAEIGPRIDEACVVARSRAAAGRIPPRFILVATVGQMKRFIEPEARRNILVSTLEQRGAAIQGLDPAVLSARVTEAEKIVSDSVLPAYRRAIDLLEKLIPQTTDDAGLCRFKGGDAAYAQALRDHTSTDLTADQIHQIGLREVARLEAEMDPLLRQLGLSKGTVAERMKELNEQSYYPDEPDVRAKILADYDHIIRDAEKRCETLFDLRPKAGVVVKRESEFSEQNASANYMPPANDGSMPGVFRVPLPGPRFPKDTQMRSLAYHETVPGHHFQLALQREMKDLPRFVRDEAFPGGTAAFGEGWALYAEYLANEAGWYEGDLRGKLGCLDLQLYRAKRLVVDTGLHAKGWSRQQAIDYGFSASAVERYVAWPGQACAYMIGELKIIELREKARGELGSRFSLKEFHNVLLRTGAVPLPLLERVVDDYIAATKAAKTS